MNRPDIVNATMVARRIARAVEGYDETVVMRISSNAVAVQIQPATRPDDTDAVWSLVSNVIGDPTPTNLDGLYLAVANVDGVAVILTAGKSLVEVLP